MRIREALRAGHAPSLFASLLHFEVGFGCWVILGALGPFVARDLSLSPAMKGLVVAVPLLAGAAFRIVVGALADSFGARRIGTLVLACVTIPLVWGWLAGSSLVEIFVIGALLGIAGSSFAIAMPLAAAHYPPSHRGLATGIAGAGNSGTIMVALIAPRIAERVGWHATFGFALVPLVAVMVAFRMLAREVPVRSGRAGSVLAPLRSRDCWRLCGLYAVTFGGYVGLASYLPLFLSDAYGISRVTAATVAAVAAGCGSLSRPVGGWLSDHAGGRRVLVGVYACVAAGALALASLPPLRVFVVVVALVMGALGVGNGAVFQLASQRFPARIGAVAGLVGAAGGVGGFLLPTILGVSRAASASYRAGFLLFVFAACIALLSLRGMGARWTAPAEMADEVAA